MSEKNSWKNANFEDITPKDMEIEGLPIYSRKPTKSMVVKKLREISFRTLSRFGSGNLIPELNKRSKDKSAA